MASATLVAAALTLACATAQFAPPVGSERINTTELRDEGDALLRDECPRLLGGGDAATGEAVYVIDVTRGGDVTRVRLIRGSGD